jgi:hypothetical protein
MRQTIQQRAAEVRQVVERVQQGLLAGRVRIVVGQQGGVAFTGLSEEERAGITDGCIYRRMMITGSALTRAAIARAEQLAGRSINPQTVAQGLHSHDGGKSWHGHD